MKGHVVGLSSFFLCLRPQRGWPRSFLAEAHGARPLPVLAHVAARQTGSPSPIRGRRTRSPRGMPSARQRASGPILSNRATWHAPRQQSRHAARRGRAHDEGPHSALGPGVVYIACRPPPAATPRRTAGDAGASPCLSPSPPAPAPPAPCSLGQAIAGGKAAKAARARRLAKGCARRPGKEWCARRPEEGCARRLAKECEGKAFRKEEGVRASVRSVYLRPWRSRLPSCERSCEKSSTLPARGWHLRHEARGGPLGARAGGPRPGGPPLHPSTPIQK